MKYIIAFMFFFFAPNLVPTTVLAITHPTNTVSTSSIVFKRKLSLKEKLYWILKGEPKQPLTVGQKLFVAALCFVVLGLILFAVGSAKSKVPSDKLSFSGLTEFILGIGAEAVALITFIIGVGVRNKEVREKQKNK